MRNGLRKISLKDWDLPPLKPYSCNSKISAVQFLGERKKILPINNFTVLRRSKHVTQGGGAYSKFE